MKTYLIADTHFGHQGVCNFLRADGTKLRPWNKSQDMDSELIQRWNSTVKQEDKVYHLGDVAMSKRHLEVVGMLNGTKVLIKGNHDREKLSMYSRLFKDVRAYHLLDNYILSHVPIHPGSKGRFKGNIHGHTHYNAVHNEKGELDNWYFPVSVEHINYTPIDFEEIKKRYEITRPRT